MNIAEFFNQFDSEEKCITFFKEKREKEGIVCKKCANTTHYWLKTANKWQCKKCKHGTTLKSGTVMENSNLKFKIWLWAIYLMSFTKKGMSALEMQRQLQHTRYEPIWLLMHKIRISMGHRDDKYQLDGFVEMDEGFFEGHRKKEDKNELAIIAKTPPIKELDRQVRAIVAVTTVPIPLDKQKKGKPTTMPGNLKINVVQQLTKIEMTVEIDKMVKKSATVHTDGKRSYKGLEDLSIKHISTVVVDKKKVCTLFPWVHISISNMKKKLLGLHHHVKNVYMQNYFDEFCYKFNRRNLKDDLFNRLVIACISNAWYKPCS